VRRRPLPETRLHRASGVLAAATVGLQVAYPLTRGRSRNRISIATVIAFAGSTLVHEASQRGRRSAAALLAIAGGGGLAVEFVGLRTGKPFGRYAYSPNLGLTVAAVPAVVPLAWLMMAGPALAATRRLTDQRATTAVVGGLALGSWDVFLDPQMVRDGNWSWQSTGPALQGIPLVNYAGWLVTATAMIAALDRALPRDGDDAVPLAMYLWTYFGSVLANAVFLRRPGVALSGGLAMGTVALPLVRRLTT
jgi:putative membrane protein